MRHPLFGATVLLSPTAIILGATLLQCGSSTSSASGSGSGAVSGSSGANGGMGSAGSSSSGTNPTLGNPNGPITYDAKSCSWVGGATESDALPTGNTAVLTGSNGCAGGTCLNPDCKPNTTPAPLDMYPGISFDPMYDGPDFLTPSYIPTDVIIPTLDDVTDGPDIGTDGYGPGNWTKSNLAFLDANNMHWDVFANTNNWDGPIVGDPTMDDPDGYNNFIDMLTKHNVSDHTVHHTWMGSSLNDTMPLDPTMPQCCDCTDFPTVTCDSEVSGVETVLAKMSNGGKARCTRFRPPYGWPYETAGQQGLADVEPIVAKYGVYVGWNFQTHDADNSPCSCIDETAGQACSTDTENYNTVTSVVSQVMTQIATPGKGTAWGVVLLHGVLPWTAGAVRQLFGPTGLVTKAGFRTGTVEDAICWKYGMHSWDIVNKINNYTGTDARVAN